MMIRCPRCEYPISIEDELGYYPDLGEEIKIRCPYCGEEIKIRC